MSLKGGVAIVARGDSGSVWRSQSVPAAGLTTTRYNSFPFDGNEFLFRRLRVKPARDRAIVAQVAQPRLFRQDI